MPSQFEILNEKLNRILDLLQSQTMDLTQEAEFDEGIPTGTKDIRPKHQGDRVTRTHVQYRTLDGGYAMAQWSEVDPRIIEAIRISGEMNEPWELFETQSGDLRVMVSNEVSAIQHKRNTAQAPVPRDVEGFDALGVDEV